MYIHIQIHIRKHKRLCTCTYVHTYLDLLGNVVVRSFLVFRSRPKIPKFPNLREVLNHGKTMQKPHVHHHSQNP